MQVLLDTKSIDSYRLFLRIKQLPRYSIRGHVAEFPDEYAGRLGMEADVPDVAPYEPSARLFDYQEAISELAIRKRKFAVFADCGLGKTLILLEFARYAASVLPAGRCVLIISPLMVVEQTLAEAVRFYGHRLPIEWVRAGQLAEWLSVHGKTNRIGITNYEALRDSPPQGYLGCLILDESGILKSHYGKYGRECIRLGKGIDWKLCCTGTPAPNDRIEYANHAVFLDQFPTVNAFLARYFVNKGQTSERWILKPHALRPFYRALSHWSIFLTNPGTYGWGDNAGNIPPIHVHQHYVQLTPEQSRVVQGKSKALFVTDPGGITHRTSWSTIAKGWKGKQQIPTNKPEFIKSLVDSWPDESTLIWCIFDREQDIMDGTFPDAASLRGATSYEQRRELIADFKEGRRRVMISKSQILGFGLNLQRATRQVFSGLADSYEKFYQCVKRSNRIGSTRPLNVHIPMTDIEEPMISNVLRKARMVQQDAEEQEQIFKEAMQG